MQKLWKYVLTIFMKIEIGPTSGNLSVLIMQGIMDTIQ